MTQETLSTCVVLIPLMHKSNGTGKLEDLYDRDLYEKIIRPEIESAGLQPWSAVEALPDFRIIDQLRLQIQRSALVVADLRDNNPNVIYEAGWAHALRKPVLLIATDINSIPFDLLDFFVLLYDSNKMDAFQKKLGHYLRRYTHEKV